MAFEEGGSKGGRTNSSWMAPQKHVALAESSLEKPSLGPFWVGKLGAFMCFAVTDIVAKVLISDMRGR